TRFSRDWSSDVCSSDLDSNDGSGEPGYKSALEHENLLGPDPDAIEATIAPYSSVAGGRRKVQWLFTFFVQDASANTGDVAQPERSEERRVGKEVRRRGQ